MTIVRYHFKPKRAPKKSRPSNSRPAGSSRPNRPGKWHYGENREGVPDDPQRAELARQFIERTLKPSND